MSQRINISMMMMNYAFLLSSLFGATQSLSIASRSGTVKHHNAATTSSRLFRSHSLKRPSILSNLIRPQSSSLCSTTTNTPSIDTTTSSSSSASNDDTNSGLGAWIPVGSAKQLAPLSPTKIEIMGQDFAVWQSPKTKQWSVIHDACPHRLAPLSQGRIDPDSGCIECPYHGWQFEEDGTVQSIPQFNGSFEKAKETNRDLSANSVPVHVCGDLLFAFLPSKLHGEMYSRDVPPEEIYPVLHEQMANGVEYFVRDLPYSFDILVENFMDPAHIPYAHHGLQAVRTDGSPVDMKLEVMNYTHVELGFKDVNNNKTRIGIMSFQRPTFYRFATKTEEEGAEYKGGLMIHCVPVRAGKTRVIFNSLKIGKLPTWLMHAGSNRFLNTDTWLHDAERRAKTILMEEEGKYADGDLPYVFASNSDLGVSSFRKWRKQHGMVHSPPHAFGTSNLSHLPSKPLTRYEQIDPWLHHSQHCASCRVANERFKKLQRLGLAMAVLSPALLPNRKWRFLMSGLGLGMNLMCKSIRTFIVGNVDRSGVDDRSVAAIKE